MPNKSTNRGSGHRDVNEVAYSIVQQATSGVVKPKEEARGKRGAIGLRGLAKKADKSK
jgi:hypothetical protein